MFVLLCKSVSIKESLYKEILWFETANCYASSLVQEPLEPQPMNYGVAIGEAKAIRDEAAGRRIVNC
jgi:hypothetical protein